jgi:hypothetical protein
MQIILNKFLALSAQCRARRLERLRRIMQLRGNESILDVGGGSDWSWQGMHFSKPITSLNLQKGKDVSGPFRCVQGDACAMSMFKDKQFDLAFSNSVIEHVGNFSKQQQMANEIRRVAKSYWVQTPYRHFPLEVHMMFPFFQYLPFRVRVWLGMRWPFSFEMMRKGDPLRDATQVWLLDIRQMKELFPEAKIMIEWFMGLPKSLVAVHKAYQERTFIG